MRLPVWLNSRAPAAVDTSSAEGTLTRTAPVEPLSRPNRSREQNPSHPQNRHCAAIQPDPNRLRNGNGKPKIITDARIRSENVTGTSHGQCFRR